MRKLLTILFILITGVCFGQINIGQRQILKLRDTLDAIHVRINSTVNISDTSSMLTKYLRKSDTTAMLSQYKHWLAGYLTSASITGKLNISDTSTMLAPYLRRSDTTTMLSKYLRSSDATSTYATIANLALKINISDSASMLSKYLRRSDTTVMLSPYHRTSDFNTATALKLNISDTSSMLSKYLRRSDTTVMLSPYLRSATAAATYATNQAIHDSINAANNIDTLRNSLSANGNPLLKIVSPTQVVLRRLKFSGSGVDTTASNDSTITAVITAGSTDTTSLSSRINLKVNISDTASMLTKYLRSSDATTTYATISNLALKNNISDTAAMLSKYLRRSDTTVMLTPYQRVSDAAATYATISNLALKVNISDTSTMLSKYLRRSDTTTMLSPYYRTSDATVALALKAPLASPTFTGTPTLPTGTIATTQATSVSNTTLATTAYVNSVRSFQQYIESYPNWNPADATTYYFGIMDQTLNPTTTVNVRTFAVPINCTLVGYVMSTLSGGAWATSEALTVSIRVNNTTDTQLSNAITMPTAFGSNPAFTSMGLSLNMNAGDKWEIKVLTPTWVTNPGNAGLAVQLFFVSR